MDPATQFKEPFQDQWAVLENLEHVDEVKLDQLIKEWRLESTGITSKAYELSVRKRDFPLADFEKIREHCSFVRHCVEDAEILREPEWWIFIGICSCCEDGNRIAHEKSKPYPKYNFEETESKFARYSE